LCDTDDYNGDDVTIAETSCGVDNNNNKKLGHKEKAAPVANNSKYHY
jgi:hypothetical protein